MHLREATRADLPYMGSIQAICNTRDVLTRYFIKNMDKYPTTYHQSSTRFCKRRASISGAVSFVVETDAADYSDSTPHDQTLEVVGFIIWQRIGSSMVARKWQDRDRGVWATVNRGLDAVEDGYLRLFPNVECTFRADLFQRLLPHLSTPFDEDVFAEAWVVDLLFVRPDWQRRGIGKMMLRWGVERATEEQVPVIVKSSALGGAAYRACGFRKLGDVAGLDQLLDPLEFGGEVPGLWVWEPVGLEGVWFEPGRRALEGFMMRQGGGNGDSGDGDGSDDAHIEGGKA